MVVAKTAYAGRVGPIALVAVDSFADDLAVDVSVSRWLDRWYFEIRWFGGVRGLLR